MNYFFWIFEEVYENDDKPDSDDDRDESENFSFSGLCCLGLIIWLI
jgi:hypothetical protein